METEFSDLSGNVEQDTPAQMVELNGSGVEDEFEVVIADDDEQQQAGGEQQARQEEQAPEDNTGEEESTAGEVIDDDLKPYSAKVQKRIMRERKIARTERERAARLEAELADEKARRTEAESHLVSTAEANIDAQIAAKIVEKRSARESGDTDTEFRLDEELAQLREDKRTVQIAKPAAPEKAEAGSAETPNKAPELSSHTKAWLQRNPWMNDPKYAMQKSVARAIDAQMYREGFRPDSQDYFNELDKRLDEVAKVPRQSATPQKPDQTITKPAKPAVGMGDSADATPRKSGGKVVLTKADLANMVKFGLDPNNKAHLREYAKSKTGATA